ncbi:MAG TPA: signal peptidase I [Myxococcaceae bacterium]|nr:signal peptidase I [Myxococcaceae bacterium]
MASATGTGEGMGLAGRLSARRSEEQERRRRSLYWRDVFTSLWAPVTVLGLLLVPYLLVVELHPPSASWAEPTMRLLGLSAVICFAGLIAWRFVARRAAGLRSLRHEARAATADVDGALRARGAGLEPRVRERLVDQAGRVEAAMLAGDAADLEKQTQTLVDQGSAIPGYHRHGRVDFVTGLAKALLVALIIRTVLIEPFKIPSGSMLPTLEIGDQIFVNKFIYGVHVPYANWVPFPLVRKPQRGDVIVFNNPVDTSKDFIKRVVGLPGDEVELRNDVVFINGREQPRRLLADNSVSWDQPPPAGEWQTVRGELFEETLDARPHLVLQTRRGQGNFGPVRVPAGTVFVMGDNRDNSADSRLGLGVSAGVEYVPYGYIKGKAMIVWLALGHDGLFSGLFGGTGIRTDRFFHPVR